MNRNPNTSGISRQWDPEFDDKPALASLTKLSRADIESVLAAITRLLSTERKVRFVGFGVFEWKPWSNRLPTGKKVTSWHLSFRPSRYVARYTGDCHA